MVVVGWKQERNVRQAVLIIGLRVLVIAEAAYDIGICVCDSRAFCTFVRTWFAEGRKKRLCVVCLLVSRQCCVGGRLGLLGSSWMAYVEK